MLWNGIAHNSGHHLPEAGSPELWYTFVDATATASIKVLTLPHSVSIAVSLNQAFNTGVMPEEC